MDLRQFAGGVTKRSVGVERLCDLSGEILRFKGSERGVENESGAAKFAQQFAGRSRSKARCEGQREPADVVIGMHREGGRRKVRSVG